MKLDHAATVIPDDGLMKDCLEECFNRRCHNKAGFLNLFHNWDNIYPFLSKYRLRVYKWNQFVRAPYFYIESPTNLDQLLQRDSHITQCPLWVISSIFCSVTVIRTRLSTCPLVRRVLLLICLPSLRWTAVHKDMRCQTFIHLSSGIL